MVSVPDRRFRMAITAGGNFHRRLDQMKKLTKLQKYHQNYAPKSRVSKVVAVTPEALEIERRAIAREQKGHFRVAARLWLLCMDAARGEVERARIAVRRDQCITKSNGLRRGEYSGVCCRGVVYD